MFHTGVWWDDNFWCSISHILFFSLFLYDPVIRFHISSFSPYLSFLYHLLFFSLEYTCFHLLIFFKFFISSLASLSPSTLYISTASYLCLLCFSSCRVAYVLCLYGTVQQRFNNKLKTSNEQLQQLVISLQCNIIIQTVDALLIYIHHILIHVKLGSHFKNDIVIKLVITTEIYYSDEAMNIMDICESWWWNWWTYYRQWTSYWQ